ncbi:preprotein translocase subunit SecB [Beggiatoa alba B18LD]|uniref:Preprotein translocase subunit SecB n=1 Tax=Beggiatoa alba B18LD TaxID=395493 RepID=I3CKI1_9GAMM|nr:protein-export chaperone SecB [Beggiatoa alba]EIJ44124.1 preprotein translocase subunit SecB [Beggiatoa alba B18LD]
MNTESQEIQMKIKLESVQVLNLNFKSLSIDSSITQEMSVSMQLSVTQNKYDDTNKRSFIVSFLIDLKRQDDSLSISIEAIAIFSTTEIVDEQFLGSSFATVNAPAIAFPFVRAYIANFTLNSGFNPIMLPSFNFQAMQRAKSELKE